MDRERVVSADGRTTEEVLVFAYYREMFRPVPYSPRGDVSGSYSTEEMFRPCAYSRRGVSGIEPYSTEECFRTEPTPPVADVPTTEVWSVLHRGDVSGTAPTTEGCFGTEPTPECVSGLCLLHRGVVSD